MNVHKFIEGHILQCMQKDRNTNSEFQDSMYDVFKPVFLFTSVFTHKYLDKT